MFAFGNIEVKLPSHLAHLYEKLKSKMLDDQLLYDVLAISKETVLLYFLEPNQTSGGPSIFTDESVPDGFFSSGTLVGISNVVHQNDTAIHSRIYVAIPFGEKEETTVFQKTPRRTKIPALKKNLGKVGYALAEKFGEQTLLEDPIAVDEKRQSNIDIDIKNRKSNHNHNPLFYNGLEVKPFTKKRVEGNDKRAVFALHWLDYGGAEKFAVSSMEKAKECGWEIYCIVDKRGNKPYEEKVRKIAKHIFYIADSLPPEHWRRFYINVFPYFGSHLFHIHHAISAYQNLPQIRSLTTRPRIIDTTHIVEHSDGGYPRVSGVFSPYIDFHHTISEQLGDYLSADLNVPQSKISLGYLIEREVASSKNSAGLDKFDDIAQECNIIFIGRFVNQKRPYVFIELVKTLKAQSFAKTTKLNFKMVGSGPLHEICKDQIKQNGLTGDIELLDADTDVDAELKKAHMLVISSENEGLTLVAYEAIRNNCIAISADVGAQCEIVAENVLFPRYPGEFIKKTTEVTGKLISDSAFLKETLEQQQAKQKAILESKTWDETLKDLYSF